MPIDKNPSPSNDREAIINLIESAVKYQNDPDDFLPLHTHNVVIVNFAGRRVSTRDDLKKVMKQAVSSSLAKVITKNEIEDIRFIRPDLAIVSCIKHVFDERGTGEPLPAKKGALTYVMVKENGGWKIALAQTTPMLND